MQGLKGTDLQSRRAILRISELDHTNLPLSIEDFSVETEEVMFTDISTETTALIVSIGRIDRVAAF